jgi:hypothetical protein
LLQHRDRRRGDRRAGGGRDRCAGAEPSGQQRGAEDDQAEGGDPRGDLRRGVADRVVEDEDAAQQRDDVAG